MALELQTDNDSMHLLDIVSVVILSHQTWFNRKDKAASNKKAKDRQLANSHIFVPVAIETAGTWNNRAVELVQELDRRMTTVTEDTS